MSLNTRDSVLKSSVKKGAKYSRTSPQSWKQNESKSKRQSGEGYTSKFTGKQIPPKTFVKIKKCCQKNCFSLFCKDEQKSKFELFYKDQCKEYRDTFLAGCLNLKSVDGIKRNSVNPKVKRINIWEFSLNMNGEKINVCRSFFLNLYQISQKRIRIIQRKVCGGESFNEQRGCHSNRPHKLEQQVWDLAIAHLKTIPNRPSHYSSSKTNKLYFDNPDLTIKTLFEGFQLYFKEKTKNNLKMAYKTYFKFFRETNYDFKSPKTDVCDMCSECDIKLTQNPFDECRVGYEIHKRKAARFFEMKRDYIAEAKTSNETMVIEFDYSQNLPLPKLATNKQFYKRLLWLYVFNIHCHNDDSSYMYTFLESESKKGANTVSSFLLDFLMKKTSEYPNLKKVILLSDAAGGQNKNAILMRFCSYMAKSLEIEIIQLYPVRGHSFGQSDRNFGVLRNSLKNKQQVETPDVYYEHIEKMP